MPRQYGITGFQSLAAAPSVGPAGSTYFDSVLNLAYVSDGVRWAQVSADYIASRGPGLVTNGSALLGNNYNWGASYDLVKSDHPVGAAGSFQARGSAPVSTISDELIPIDPAGFYDMTFAYRQVAGDGARTFYSYLVPYDADKQQIGPYQYMEQANTRTTLAVQLKPGDTTITLASAANWNNTAPSPSQDYMRSMIIWAYTDGQGYVWPPGTYSRLWYSNLYPVGGISGNIITLTSPWAGATYPVGTVVGNGSSGGNFMYGAANVLAPAAWTNYGPYRYGGVHTNLTASASSAFPAGTSYAKVGFLHNYSTNDPTAISRVANINLVQVSAVARQGLPSGGSTSQVLSKKSATDYDTQWVTGSGAPSGPAGGDLSGTYPNPQIAAGVIVDADVNAAAAIAQSKISGLATSLGAKTDTTRALTAGAGLTGGGDLSADRSFDVGAGAGITVAADSVAVNASGAWGTAPLTSPLPYDATTRNFGDEIYLDTNGQLRSRPQVLYRSLTGTALPSAYPMGQSILSIGPENGTGWPGNYFGAVVTIKRMESGGNLNAQTQQWFYRNNSADVYYRYAYNDTPGWTPWLTAVLANPSPTAITNAFSAAANFTITTQQCFLLQPNLLSVYVDAKYVGAGLTYPVGTGDVPNTKIVNFDLVTTYVPLQDFAMISSSGTRINAYLWSAGGVYLAALGGSANLATNETVNFAGLLPLKSF